MTKLVTLLFLLVVFSSTSVTVHAADTQETYFLPVYARTRIPGAFGSEWVARLTIHNAGETFVRFGPCNVPSASPCPPVVFGIQPGETLVDPRVGLTDAGLRGRFVYLDSEHARDVDMKLRLADVSRQTLDSGTEIPVPRAGDFRGTTIRLLNVPIGGAARTTLRIFELLDRGDAARVSVAIYTIDGVPLSHFTQAFNPSGYAHQDGFAYAPSFIESALEPLIGTELRHVRIDITPVSDNTRIWAYASITNNATQHVTLVTPP